MDKFIKNNTFKLKGCKVTWRIIQTFEFENSEMCVAIHDLSSCPGVKIYGIFRMTSEGPKQVRS